MEHTICPLDGRYYEKVKELRNYFNEFSFFKYRLFVELTYFIELINVLPQLEPLTHDFPIYKKNILSIYVNFTIDDFHSIKKYEQETNHDVKALEYFIQDKFKQMELQDFIQFIHFGLTSQDINTSANILSIKHAFQQTIIPALNEIIHILKHLVRSNKNTVMISFTHGQPAVPTTVGKELLVFLYRIEEQLSLLNDFTFTTKFGGAVGNFNSHRFAFPDINWQQFADKYIESIGLKREIYTTQISNYDNLCNFFNLFKNCNNIINDLNIDSWLYISKGYFAQKFNSQHTGSSTMPHKINPIHFENSEGNICIANSLIEGITRKINISRLQRDLTDSTILRNLGLIFGYSLLSYKSTFTGLDKIIVNIPVLKKDLNNNLIVLTEAIQTILRKHSYDNAFETIKNIVRVEYSNEDDIFDVINNFINELPQHIQNDLDDLNIRKYIGYSSDLFV